MRQTIGVIFALYGWGSALGWFLEGCAPRDTQVITETVENAAAVAQYKVLLGECRKKGREARSLEVYEACADALDADLCRRKSVRCADGGAP